MTVDINTLFSNKPVENREPYIILEAGINHNGDINIAKKMISVAKSAGANAIKFQTFKADEFVGDPELLFTYSSQGKKVTESMRDMFRRYEFSVAEWHSIKNFCDEKKITFLSTPQNVTDMELLLQLGVSALKVGSTGLPLLISCGMANLGEVYQALDVTGAMEGKPVVLMLCTSQYPTPVTDVNLSKLKTLAAAFPNLVLGFSDHTQGPLAAAIAYGLGAVVFEKHFTLDHQLPGPDHWFSEDPKGAQEWVSAIRDAHLMLGSPLIRPTIAEQDMKVLARRSITTLKDITPGEILNNINIGLRRPGNGLPPIHLDDVLGRVAKHRLQKGTLLSWEDIS